ncbi:DinB family protein [Antrihabitans sp. YC2-6]|uniref:DinB family protein n=1 Tax=Antrihabitans sp. YC2-6 TaxID=2799498 RepID=UPI0018F7BEC0|nr:DinB family protein [Antrihabitans sp. YC2-6]MBJ8346023.1 DinB family protein [Antrihabitans sp. YC2-6]
MTNTEREDLITMLADQREQFRIAVSGLDETQARLRSTVSEFTLGGLLHHVSNCEKHWLEVVVERDENAEMDMSKAAEEYVIGDHQTVDGLLAEWDKIVARTEEVVRGVASLDDVVPLPTAPWAPEREWWTVRRILLHVFREIAHHSGHADIIRESIDGSNTTFKRAGIDPETAASWAAEWN